MIKDLPNYTFYWAEIYPRSNYATSPPIRNYSTIYENSTYGGSTTKDLSSERLIFPLQSYFSQEGGLGLLHSAKNPPKPEVFLTEAKMDFTTAPTDWHLGGRSDLFYVAIISAGPGFKTSGFLNWERGWGVSVYHELQFYDQNGNWKGYLDSQIWYTGDDVKGYNGMISYKSNFDDIKAYWNDAQYYGFTPICSYCTVSHQGNGIDEFADYSSADGSGNLTVGQRNTQVLKATWVIPMADDLQLWRMGDSNWDRPNYYLYPSYPKYVKYYPNVRQWKARADGASMAVGAYGAEIAFQASTYNYYGTTDLDFKIRDNLADRFVQTQANADKANAYLNARREHINVLIGKTLKIPKEYRARRQPAPTLQQQQLSSIAETNQYVSDITPSVPGAATSATPSIGTTYSGGSSGGSTSGGY